MSNEKRCKTCSETWEKHIVFISEAWPQESASKCNRFLLMTNLDYVEYKYNMQSINRGTNEKEKQAE